MPIILINLAISEHVASVHKLFHQLYATLVVGRQVVAIGKVERVDVILRRRIAAVDDLQRFFVGGGTNRSPALSF